MHASSLGCVSFHIIANTETTVAARRIFSAPTDGFFTLPRSALSPPRARAREHRCHRRSWHLGKLSAAAAVWEGGTLPEDKHFASCAARRFLSRLQTRSIVGAHVTRNNGSSIHMKFIRAMVWVHRGVSTWSSSQFRPLSADDEGLHGSVS